MQMSQFAALHCAKLMRMEKSTHIAAEADGAPKQAEAPARASLGERAFNWLTYGAWNHGVNLILSTAIAVLFRDSNPYKNAISWLEKRGISKSSAELMTGITVLSSGGHITAAGVKLLEDRKRPIVDDLNARFSPEEKGQPLHDDRKQTWLSVTGARAFTLVLALVSFGGIKSFVGHNEQGVPRLKAFEDRVGRKFASKSAKAMAAADVTTTTAYKLGSVLSLEVVVVTVMSSLFYFFSKFLSKSEPDLMPRKVKPQVNASKAEEIPEQEVEKTNFAERVRAREMAESLGSARA